MASSDVLAFIESRCVRACGHVCMHVRRAYMHVWLAVEKLTSTLFALSVGADLIYDPECIPDLVRLLKLFLSRGCKQDNGQAERIAAAGNRDMYIEHQNQIENHNYVRPIAYLATVIRNIDTLNMFVSSARFAGLYVEDVTQSMRPPVFVPQIAHIDRSSICLHRFSI